MKTAGTWLAGAGILLAFVAMAVLPTTAPSSDVLNIGLLQQQQQVFLGGCTLFLAGIVLWVGGAIEDRMLRIFRRLAPAAVAAPVYDASVPAAVPEPDGDDAIEYENAPDPDEDWGIVIKIIGAIIALGLIVGLLGYLTRTESPPAAVAIEMNAGLA